MVLPAEKVSHVVPGDRRQAFHRTLAGPPQFRPVMQFAEPTNDPVRRLVFERPQFLDRHQPSILELIAGQMRAADHVRVEFERRHQRRRGHCGGVRNQAGRNVGVTIDAEIVLDRHQVAAAVRAGAALNHFANQRRESAFVLRFAVDPGTQREGKRGGPQPRHRLDQHGESVVERFGVDPFEIGDRVTQDSTPRRGRNGR